ncbi:hypothetical protein [Streptomyces sp. NPDC127190]|uniref:hypothetical protein n=1 Tax=unclassified Streptomyces TaxID=2593676 RepID=UPI003639D89D
MNFLPLAEAPAHAACELHDAALPGSWNAAAVEDALEAMETTALALRAARPAAAAATESVVQALSRLRRDLGLITADGSEGQDQAVSPPALNRRPKARRGLGLGIRACGFPSAVPTRVE